MIKEKDFIELDYTGKTQEEGIIFDTTDTKVAQENGIAEKAEAKIVCVGQSQLLKGLDADVLGKEVGKEYTVTVKAEDAFGKKSAKFVQLVPTNKFKKQNINPMPGLQVNIDNHIGVIKTVTGGRTLVDFNHPLASKDLIYTYKINKIVEDTKEKAENYIKMAIGLPAKIELEKENLEIKVPFPLEQDAKDKIGQMIMEVIPEIKKVNFAEEKPKAPKKE